MSHAINLSKPKIIFVSPLNLKRITNVAKKHPFVKQVILYDFEETFAKPATILSLTDMIESIDNAEANKFKCEPQNMKENVAFVLCSSGTTGLPKGVQLTQFNMLVSNFQNK